MTPFGDQQPDAPNAAAFLDCYTHSGMIHWTLNVTDVEGFSKAKLVYGNPDITAIDGECLQSGRCSRLLLHPCQQQPVASWASWASWPRLARRRVCCGCTNTDPASLVHLFFACSGDLCRPGHPLQWHRQLGG